MLSHFLFLLQEHEEIDKDEPSRKYADDTPSRKKTRPNLNMLKEGIELFTGLEVCGPNVS